MLIGLDGLADSCANDSVMGSHDRGFHPLRENANTGIRGIDLPRKSTRVLAIVEVERGETSGVRTSRIHGKLDSGQARHPVGLIGGNTLAKHLCHRPISPFGGAVGLRMVSGREAELRAEKFVETTPECAGKEIEHNVGDISSTVILGD